MDGVACNQTTGACPGNCAPGFTGINCQENCLPFNGSKASCSTTCTDFLDPFDESFAPVITASFSSFQNEPRREFTWNPVNCSNGSIIENYVYKFGLYNSDEEPDVVRTEGLFVVVPIPRCGPQYEFEVAAETTKGTGPFSFKRRFHSDRKAPGAIGAQITARKTNYNSLILSWTAPYITEDYPCPASNYLVTVDLINLGKCSEVRRQIEWMNVTASNITLDDLEAYSTYSVSVTPQNDFGDGLMTSSEVTTGETTPQASPTFNSSVVTIGSITWTWNSIPCGSRGGEIILYATSLKTSNLTVDEKNVSTTSVKYTGLLACTRYTVSVWAYTKAGRGERSNDTRLTKTDVPFAVSDIISHVVSPRRNEFAIQWTALDERCRATSYRVTYELFELDHCKRQPSLVVTCVGTVNTTHATIYFTAFYSKYRVNIAPVNDAGEGEINSIDLFTNESIPIAAPVLRRAVSNDIITFSWDPIPCGSRQGNITHFEYRFQKQNQQGQFETIDSNNVTNRSVTIPNFSSYTNYSIRVRAYTRIGPGPWKIWTLQGDPETPGSSFVGIVVGVVVFLLLAVVTTLLVAAFVRKRRQQRGKSLSVDSNVDGIQAICADAKQCNVELQGRPSRSGYRASADTSVSADESPKLRPSTTSTDSSKPGPSSNAPLNKSTPYVKPHAKPKTSQSFPQAGPVAMAHLAEYIKRKTSGKISGFQQDYELIPGEPLYSWSVAKQDHNKKKNRYNNILAYDCSRVVLECLKDDPQSDYINASYINGYKQESKYIACQGPSSTSVNDMWRMVWQERVGKIVMLTNLIENGKGKCEQYWPDENGAVYGDQFIRKVDETPHSNFVVRTFHISKSSEPEGEYRELIHFQYITWPDMKVPESSPLLQFVRVIRATETSQHGPIVVHCSAGVGRTGTFISVDSMLDMAEAEGQVDVLQFVRNMREQRFLMVQTLKQYRFIFDVLLESSLSENTAIKADQFHQHYAKLKKCDKKTGTNGIQAQFQLLESFTASSSDDQCMGGRNAANVDKNRFKDCIPKDSTRPYLMTNGREGSTNYINAAFLDGHKGENAYLATQAPLPNTAGDIWRMVFDYKSFCMVMLNSMDDDPSVVQYWPEKDSLQFGPLAVTFKREDRHSNDIIIRLFDVTYPLRKSDEVQSVCHIQYLGWPSGKEVPNSPSSLLKVLEAVKVWTRDHPDGPITVHCIDGVGCSGTFCAILTLMDHLLEEKVVDVFQAVKKLRTSRAGMVNTLSQYQFCYQVVQTYLDSSSIYENYR
ncbi:receptor-type tyrosine-protein phosphatase T-like [Acanthaster planci]|uniref:protein-tyrosine-phosphatase n=1 Tax=Acanthaster planci TaxID=133434 RepID=A0A8B7Z1B4_ACAPL|nr:receptor-type tyrosine-protein phosphatase T-like [Acanthaster planci]